MRFASASATKPRAQRVEGERSHDSGLHATKRHRVRILGRSPGRLLLLCVLLLAQGCTIGRWYVGSALPADPREVLVVHETPKAQVLAQLGPPDRILRYKDSDVFIYRHDQRNSSELDIGTPPFITFGHYTIFDWVKIQDKSDELMVFFDTEGVVSAFGYRQGRNELEPL